MLILDTRELPQADRAEAFRVAMSEASVPCRIEHRQPTARFQARMELVPLGPGSVFTTAASGFRLVRTPRHVRMDSAPVIALSFQGRGTGEYAQLGHEQLVHGQALMLVDLTAPYSFGCATGGDSRSFQVPHDQVGLPVDVVRRAIPRLAASPMHGLVRSHLQRVCATAPAMATDPGGPALGSATTQLLRALIVSAAGEQRLLGGVLEETLLARVQVFLARRLTDPGLTPASIAAAHAVSVRRLYGAFSAAGLSLEQSLITARLDRARDELAAPAGRRRTIAGTARACGFADASHFTRRFTAAYGLTPREWRAASSPP